MPKTTADLPFDDSRDLIKKDKLLELYELSPEFATITGYHELDDRLAHADNDAIEEEMKFIADWLAELRALPSEQFTPEQQLDLKLFEHYYALQRFYFDEARVWEKSPTAITEAGQICFLALLHETEDEEKRFNDIASRLEQIPRYVKEHKSRMVAPPQRWRDISLQSTQGMAVFFDAMVEAAQGKISEPLAQRLTKAASQAKTETSAYLDWLGTLEVDRNESWVLGPEQFGKLLGLRDLGMDAAEILALGEDYLQRYEKEARDLAQQLVGSNDIGAAREKIRANTPVDFATALQVTKETCAEAKEFLQKHHLMDLPPDEELRVHETPEFLRPLIPFAAIFPPARFAPKQISNYIVTPPSDPQHLAKHLNYANIYNTAVHEGYPGHHLQLSTANQSCTFLRSTPFVGGKAVEFVEGWAHYCEELMKSHGFHDTLEGRFAMVSDLIWRAARIIIDVKLSQGLMSYDEGVKFLMEKAHMSEDGARGELNRYTHTPSYQLSYLLGKHMILDLKQAVQVKEKDSFSEASFHNRLLRTGSIPISITRREIFGIG